MKLGDEAKAKADLDRAYALNPKLKALKKE